MKSIITLTESKRFVELEKTIERGKKTFVEVGTALAEIRDSKLYRCDFDTFDQYCKDKWGWDRTYSHRLIDAAGVVKMLPIGNKIQTESQARQLAKVEPERRVEVLEKASAKAESEDRPMTARDILESNEPEPPHIEVEAEPIAPVIEPNVTEYYSRLEKVVLDAVRDATDKQIVSMGVYAAHIPKILKDELARRKKK